MSRLRWAFFILKETIGRDSNIAKKKQKTIQKQVEELFTMSRSFGEKKSNLRDQGKMGGAITGTKTYIEYHDSCMRFVNDLADKRGTRKFQICSIKKEEVNNFLERLKLIRRPETAHQYAAALQKLELTNILVKLPGTLMNLKSPKE